ncbi:MAG: DUF4363 family protein [Firmicutes bacterium]|nr:DUF4363 family protein [Bacillota bacterium]
MHKKILSIAITFPLILALGIASMAYTHHISKTYREEIQRVEESARAGDMEGARHTLKRIIAEWETREKLLHVWVPHADTDAVSIHLQGLQVGLALGDTSLLFEHSAALMEALDHLHHRDDLTLGNIL